MRWARWPAPAAWSAEWSPWKGWRTRPAVARDLALRRATVVAITGKRDILSDGTRILGVDNGHEMLKTITGTGCMATTVVAIFCAVEPDRLVAAASALACYGLAAERAARGTRGRGPSARRSSTNCTT